MWSASCSGLLTLLYFTELLRESTTSAVSSSKNTFFCLAEKVLDDNFSRWSCKNSQQSNCPVRLECCKKQKVGSASALDGMPVQFSYHVKFSYSSTLVLMVGRAPLQSGPFSLLHHQTAGIGFNL